MIRVEDFDERIITKFRGNKGVRLYSILGTVRKQYKILNFGVNYYYYYTYLSIFKVEDSLEFRLVSETFVYDLFFSYKLKNKTKVTNKLLNKNITSNIVPLQWSGYQSGKSKYRMIVPDFDKLCSAQLLNHKFLVPCEPEKYLNKNYGRSRWKVPEKEFKKYAWPSIKKNNKWTDEQFINAVRIFNRDGQINQKRTFECVNKSLDDPFTQIYSFDDLKYKKQSNYLQK